MALSSRAGAVCALSFLVLACTDTGAATAPAGGGDAGAASGRAGTGASGGNAGGGSGGNTAGSAGRGTGGGASGRAGGSGTGSGGHGSAAGDGGSGNDGGSGASSGRGGSGGTGNAGSSGSGGTDEAGGGGGDESGAGQAGSNEPGLLPGFSVAVIGSSTAAGEGASSSARGWVSLLASSLEEAVSGESRMHNLAVGGYTTSNLLPDSGSSGSIDDALEREPNLILVALAGSNDLSNGVSTDTFLSRLRTIRETAVDAGVPIFFLSTAPKDLSNEEQEMLEAWAEAMGDEFDPCWTPNATSYSPCFIDIFSELANSSLGIADEYSAGDGIHLNDAGHERIFEVAEPIVRAYVCSMTECE